MSSQTKICDCDFNIGQCDCTYTELGIGIGQKIDKLTKLYFDSVNQKNNYENNLEN